MAAEMDIEETEGEEGRIAQGATIPHNPTRAEREEHELTHTLYRPPCDYCVRARGRNIPYRQRSDKDDDHSKVPIISFDYFSSARMIRQRTRTQ